jgi:hypothetical protein
VLSIIVDAWEGWEHNRWEVLSITLAKSIPKIALQMESAYHCLCLCQPKKADLQMGSAPDVAHPLSGFQHIEPMIQI